MVITSWLRAHLFILYFMRVRVNSLSLMFTMMMLRKMLSTRLKSWGLDWEMRNERSDWGNIGTSVSSTSKRARPVGAFHVLVSITTSTS